MDIKQTLILTFILISIPTLFQTLGITCQSGYLCYSDLVDVKMCKESGNRFLDSVVGRVDTLLDILVEFMSNCVDQYEKLLSWVYKSIANLFTMKKETIWDKFKSYATYLIPQKRKTHLSRMYDLLVPYWAPNSESLYDLSKWMPTCAGTVLTKFIILVTSPVLPLFYFLICRSFTLLMEYIRKNASEQRLINFWSEFKHFSVL